MTSEKRSKLNYDKARKLLEDTLDQIEQEFLQQSYQTSIKEEQVLREIATLFESNTQAYREVLLGCVIARLSDSSIDIAKPYVGQGHDSFNGRTLDELVINPFLHDNHIPSSKGPYLSVFRRSVQLDSSTRTGLRDKTGYDSLLFLINYLKTLKKLIEVSSFLRELMYRFVLLREESQVPLAKLHRISLEQYDSLITGLLATPSGGRFPVLLVLSAFATIKQCFGLDWEIKCQGINVADSASGAGGDVTICSSGHVVMAIEVTERQVDRDRVVSTFLTKIAPSAIVDYLFFVKENAATNEAREQAQRYFTQGHEVNFLEIKTWILMILATLGNKGRDTFNQILVNQLDAADMSRALKVAWNNQVATLVAE